MAQRSSKIILIVLLVIFIGVLVVIFYPEKQPDIEIICVDPNEEDISVIEQCEDVGGSEECLIIPSTDAACQ